MDDEALGEPMDQSMMNISLSIFLTLSFSLKHWLITGVARKQSSIFIFVCFKS